MLRLLSAFRRAVPKYELAHFTQVSLDVAKRSTVLASIHVGWPRPCERGWQSRWGNRGRQTELHEIYRGSVQLDGQCCLLTHLKLPYQSYYVLRLTYIECQSYLPLPLSNPIPGDRLPHDSSSPVTTLRHFSYLNVKHSIRARDVIPNRSNFRHEHRRWWWASTGECSSPVHTFCYRFLLLVAPQWTGSFILTCPVLRLGDQIRRPYEPKA